MPTANRGCIILNELEYNLPPQNIEFEESVLSGCLLFPEICEQVLDILIDLDFYKTAHQEIFKAIQDLKFKGQPVDLVTVVEKLKHTGSLEKTGGASYLSRLTNQPIPTDTEYYCKQLKTSSLLRNTINLCQTTLQNCYQANGNALEILDKFQNKSLSLELDKTSTYKNMKELVIEGEDRHEIIFKQKKSITGVPTGFTDLDFITCGLQPSDLIILAARPSMGKSAIATNMSVNMAKMGFSNAFFSVEMARSQLYDRMLSGESGINSVKFRNGRFTREEWEIKTDASAKLYDLPIFIEDEDCFTFMDICRKARRLKKKENIKAIIIDYLQLIEGDSTKKKNYEIADMTKGFKRLGKELMIPVLLLCQLNRECEKRDDKRPMLSDLKDSGSIEQDADVVMFLYRHEIYIKKKYNEDKTPTKEFLDWRGKAELDVAKQRMGPCRRTDLVWLEKITTFHDAIRQ